MRTASIPAGRGLLATCCRPGAAIGFPHGKSLARVVRPGWVGGQDNRAGLRRGCRVQQRCLADQFAAARGGGVTLAHNYENVTDCRFDIWRRHAEGVAGRHARADCCFHEPGGIFVHEQGGRARHIDQDSVGAEGGDGIRERSARPFHIAVRQQDFRGCDSLRRMRGHQGKPRAAAGLFGPAHRGSHGSNRLNMRQPMLRRFAGQAVRGVDCRDPGSAVVCTQLKEAGP